MSHRFLALRLSAPLMAAGTVAVDTRRFTDSLPTQSMLTGLIGNALGYTHGDIRHAMLQASLEYAARADRPGRHMEDYQTVAVSRRDRAWTTLGAPASRRGALGEADTHIRQVHYLTDAVWTVALRVEGQDTDALAEAVSRPARPLFIGRKSCLPVCRLLLRVIDAADVLLALKAVPGSTGPMPAIWPADIDHGDPAVVQQARDLRDWIADNHTGTRAVRRGTITVAAAE